MPNYYLFGFCARQEHAACPGEGWDMDDTIAFCACECHAHNKDRPVLRLWGSMAVDTVALVARLAGQSFRLRTPQHP
jgi:hypothetical protein